jgi:hypothetical protein
MRRIPGSVLDHERSMGIRAAFTSAAADVVFRNTLISWMFLGFGNLMMNGLRVEYLANPAYGISLSTERIAFFCGVVPNIVRLLFNPVWGELFDRMNFFILRGLLNLGFLAGIGAFFLSNSTTGFFIGALLVGIAASGGDVAWNLWVTKFAPTEKVAGYMAVHTFLTGLRGVVAPLTGFMLLEIWSIQSISLLAMALVVISIVILAAEFKKGN